MVEAQEIAKSAARNKKFVDALKKGDFAALREMYTNDAVMLPPGANIIVGKGNIQAFWEKMSGEMQDVELEAVNVAALGSDAIREIGTFRITRKPNPAAIEDNQGAPQDQERSAKYVFVWRKVGADWKVAASIWNRNANQNPGQGRRPGGGGPGGPPGGRPGGPPGGRNARGFGGG